MSQMGEKRALAAFVFNPAYGHQALPPLRPLRVQVAEEYRQIVGGTLPALPIGLKEVPSGLEGPSNCQAGSSAIAHLLKLPSAAKVCNGWKADGAVVVGAKSKSSSRHASPTAPEL